MPLRNNTDRLTLLSMADWKAKARAAGADHQAQKTAMESFGALKSGTPHRVKVIDEAERIIEFVISTSAVDRDDDTLNVGGWDLGNYQRNPVVLPFHDHYQPVVGRSLRTWVEGGQLKARTQFTPRELNPLGYTLYQLYAADYMRATSVGFMPQEWTFAEDRKHGVNFMRQELLEYSMVPVPSNAEALAVARSKGVDLRPVRDSIEHSLDLLKVTDVRDAELKRHLETLRAVSDPTGRKLVTVLDDILVLDDEPRHTKAGRVLSKRSEDKLRDAYTHIGDVLAQLEDDEDADVDDDKAIRRTGGAEHVIDLEDDDIDLSDPEVAQIIADVLREVVDNEVTMKRTGRLPERRGRR